MPVRSAPVSTVNAYLGISRTLYNGMNRLVGSTTVQPAHALDTWRQVAYGLYGLHEDGSVWYFGTKRVARRNGSTGRFFFWTYTRDSYTGGWNLAHQEPFWVGDDRSRLARMTYTCVPTPGSPFVYNEWEDFTLAAWSASIKKSGGFPPGEPYESYLRSDVESLQYNCDDVSFSPSSGSVRGRRIDLPESGVVSVTMPITQRKYAFPMLQWVGKWYDY